jgi:ATP-dependent protease Clp ATPase subunit
MGVHVARHAATLIAGPGVYICNECVDLCVESIAKKRPKPDRRRARPDY